MTDFPAPSGLPPTISPEERAIVGFLLWMALHFVHDPGVWGWRQLIVLAGGCVLIGAWLYIVK